MTIFATNLQARAHVYILSVFIGPFYSCSVQCQKNVFVEGVYRVSFFFFFVCVLFVLFHLNFSNNKKKPSNLNHHYILILNFVLLGEWRKPYILILLLLVSLDLVIQ